LVFHSFTAEHIVAFSFQSRVPGFTLDLDEHGQRGIGKAAAGAIETAESNVIARSPMSYGTWRDTSFSGNRYACLAQTLYEMQLVFRAVNSQCDFVSCVLEEARHVGFKPFSLGTSQVHLAELAKNGEQNDMVDRIGVKVRQPGRSAAT